MNKSLGLFLLLIFISSCSGSGDSTKSPQPPINIINDLTQNSFTYSGILPTTSQINYSNKAGDPIQAPGAYAGFIEIYVTPNYDLLLVKQAVSAINGLIIAQTPALGIYVIQVPVGTEASALTSLFLNSWVLEGGAVIPALIGGNIVFDWNFGGNDGSCLDYHGDLVTNIANRRGGNTFTLEPVSVHAKMPHSLSDLMLRKLQAVPEGEHQIINMSIGYDLPDGNSVSDYITPECNIFCVQKMVAFQEYIFLRRFYSAMEQLYLTNPDVANRNVVSIIGGNTGVALDDQLAALKLNFPNAFKRIVIVGGVDSTGDIGTRDEFNYLTYNTSMNMIYARGIDVKATSPATGDKTCTGSSYAAPEVSSILEHIWSRNPLKTSEQILAAIKQALVSRSGSIPQDANGLTTQAFLDEVLNILNPPACSYVYSAFGTCQSNSSQSRSVISSSPVNCVGTPVLTQSCTYVVSCSYTYSLWGSCQANSTQTRSVISSSPAGCSGTPITSQSCVNACHVCNYDINCTVYGYGGCWRCTNSTYVGGICQGSGNVFSGTCVADPDNYTVCQ